MEETLKQLQCPFTWNLPKLRTCEDKQLLKNNEEQNEFLIQGFCLNIAECYQRALRDELEVAIRKANECKTELMEYSPVGRYLEVDKYLFNKCKNSFWNILLSTEAHLAYMDSDLERAEQKINELSSYEIVNDDDVAVFWAVRCSLLLLHKNFSAGKEALKSAREAVELDPSVPLWHFLLGKSLATHRRHLTPYELPNEEEIHELKTAWTTGQKPYFGVMLLMSYQNVYRLNRNDARLKNEILDIIRDIKVSAADEWYIYWRCAHVCTRIGRNLLPKEDIKNLIDLAVKYSKNCQVSPDMYLYALQASYYKFIECNLPKALEFSEKAADCGEHSCAFDVISLTYLINKECDPLSKINKYVSLCCEEPEILDCLLLHKACYLTFVKRDSTEGLKLFIEIMSKDYLSSKLMKWRPLFKEEKKIYNLYEKLIEDLKFFLNKAKSREVFFQLITDLNKVKQLYKKAKEV